MKKILTDSNRCCILQVKYLFRNIETVKFLTSGVPMSAPVNSKDDIENQVCRLHAEICQTLSNPKRLRIINILRKKEVSAGELQKMLKIPKANLSQHMAVLRQKGIVVSRREGNTVYYRLGPPQKLQGHPIFAGV